MATKAQKTGRGTARNDRAKGAKTTAKAARGRNVAVKGATARSKPSKLKLTFGCGSYDRMEALWTGEVAPAGIELAVTRLDFPRRLFDMVEKGKVDAGEYGMTQLVINAALGETPFAAIPAFPSKMFRHGYIYVNRRSGIREPKDLAGRRIGSPTLTQTAAIWQRGILTHDYGADLSGVTWVTGAIDHPGPLVAGIGTPSLRVATKAERAPSGKSLDDLLVEGRIDAIIGANRAPSLGKNPDIVRLFTEYAAEERAYFNRTGIQPIMHAVVVKRSIYEKNSWVAASLYRACEAAKNRAIDAMRPWGAQKVMLPWVEEAMDEVDEMFGGDPCAYGLDANRKTLETLVGYMYEQGFIDEKPRVDDMFVPVD